MPKGNPDPNHDTRFKPGQSGNPKGRPRTGETLTDILREYKALRDVTYQGELIERQEALAHKTWDLALKGNETILRYLYDRLDGKPTQEIKVRTDVPLDAEVHIHIAGAQFEYSDDDTEPGEEPTG